MTAPIASAARIVAELRRRLQSEYGLIEGDEALETTLEGATELPEMLAMMARDAVQAEDYSKAVRDRAGIILQRAGRLDARAEKLRNAIAWALQESGWKRIPKDVLPEMTVTISVREPVAEIPNDDLVPDEFCAIKTVKKPDRVRITNLLRSGEQFDFAHLPNPKPTLTIRS